MCVKSEIVKISDSSTVNICHRNLKWLIFLFSTDCRTTIFLGVSGSRAVWEPMTDWQVNWLSMTGELTDRLVLKMLPHLKISWNLTIWPLRVRLVTEWSNAKQGWETEGSVAKNTSGVKPRFTYHRWHLCDTGYHTYKQFKYHFEDGLRLESTYIWFLATLVALHFTPVSK